MIVTPYPPGEGPLFHCTRPGPGGTSCDWTGFPTETDHCPFHQTRGRHQYEAANFNPQSFQPLWNYARRWGMWLYPADFMAMGAWAWYIDGVEVALFAYKYCETRNYLHIDDRGCSAWTPGPGPEPITVARAIDHATQPNHRHDDGCLRGSRVATVGRIRKAGGH